MIKRKMYHACGNFLFETVSLPREMLQDHRDLLDLSNNVTGEEREVSKLEVT